MLLSARPRAISRVRSSPRSRLVSFLSLSRTLDATTRSFMAFGPALARSSAALYHFLKPTAVNPMYPKCSVCYETYSSSGSPPVPALIPMCGAFPPTYFFVPALIAPPALQVMSLVRIVSCRLCRLVTSDVLAAAIRSGRSRHGSTWVLHSSPVTPQRTGPPRSQSASVVIRAHAGSDVFQATF